MAWDFFRRIRRNHALEHATITLLNRQHPEAQIVGFSGPRAVTLYTNLSVQEVYPAVKEALRLLKQGRRGLAIHPNCGTNLVTAAALTVLSTSLIMVPAAHSAQERYERLPKAVFLNALALLLAPRIGAWMQANVTVDPQLSGVEIVSLLTDSGKAFRRITIHTRQP